MEIEKAIVEKFKNVEKAYFIKEDGVNFLRIETSLHMMKDVEEISKEINSLIDSNEDNIEEQYFLDVLSKGTETPIEFHELNNEIEKNMKVITINGEVFEGILKKVLDDSIVLRYNAKGQFRNKNIAKINIETITRSAVITKEKK